MIKSKFIYLMFILIGFNGCMSLEDNLTGFGWYGITLLLTPIFGIWMLIEGIIKKEGEAIGAGIALLALGIIFYLFVL
jgi:hypothetical protein